MLRQIEMLKSFAPSATILDAFAMARASPGAKNSRGLNDWNQLDLVYTHSYLDSIGMADKRDGRVPWFVSFNHGSDKDGTIFGVGSGNECAIR